MHDRSVVHRDIKPENLLIRDAYQRNPNIFIKLADFGFAVKVRGCVLQTECGSPAYIAPEILEGRRYGKAVDMWSTGVIVYLLLGGYPPFYDENRHNLASKIKKGSYDFPAASWSSVSDDAKDLIRGLLNIDEEQRLTADQVLAHRWLRLDDVDLVHRSLDKSLDGLRRYNSKNSKRFRAAANAVIAMNKFKLMQGCHSLKTDEEEEGSVSPGMPNPTATSTIA